MAIVDAGGEGIWSIEENWPWPKVFFGRNYTLAFVKKTTDPPTSVLWVYELYCSGGTWTATAIKSLGYIAYIDSVAIADFGEFYAVSRFGNVSNVVYIDGFLRDPSGRTVDLPTQSVPAFGTCCNFNGQAIVGCIAHGSDDHWGDLGYNSVMWSRIGRFNFRISSLDDGDLESGKYPLNQPDVGYRNMEWGEWRTGIVHRVMKLGKEVLVYGDGGTGALFPVNEPQVTFGCKDSVGPPIRSGNHVAGGENEHVLIDTNNEVWRVSSRGFEKLGYKDYIGDLTSGYIHISALPSRNRYYISDGATGFCLVPEGMYETTQLVGSVGEYRGTLCGFFINGADYEARVRTDILDFNQRGMKTISGIEIGGDYYDENDTLMQAAVSYRYDHRSSGFTNTGWVSLNPEGQAVIPVTAPEFKIRLKASDYRSSGLSLDYVKPRIKMSDRRFIRGSYDASHALARGGTK